MRNGVVVLMKLVLISLLPQFKDLSIAPSRDVNLEIQYIFIYRSISLVVILRLCSRYHLNVRYTRPIEQSRLSDIIFVVQLNLLGLNLQYQVEGFCGFLV